MEYSKSYCTESATRKQLEAYKFHHVHHTPHTIYIHIASYSGSRGEEREPGTHCSHMRLIISHFCRFYAINDWPQAMLRTATKLLSYSSLVINASLLNSTSEICSEFVLGHLAEQIK